MNQSFCKEHRIMAKLRPLGDKILVKRVEAESKTKSGIVLPDTAKEKPRRGKVLAVGEGKRLDTGERAPVNVTLGPSGRNVVLEKSFGSPTVTKDGVTVAKEIELEDSYENMGAQMVKEVASKTSTVAGDGTTTATVYAEAIFGEGLRNVASGANATQIQRGINLAVEAIVDELKRMSKKVDSSKEVAQVGTS